GVKSSIALAMGSMQAHEICDVRPDEYEGRPETLSDRVPAPEARRLDTLVSRALKDSADPRVSD
ncbi:hypothetical protein, partial [Klebsiella aerogenes]|uniref:hypothetical protein n=1 Tax=Klebsiella aerogenes TaxID=548 RepID=UPI001952E74E